MAFETGYTKYPKLTMFMIFFSIFLMASAVHFVGWDGIVEVESFWETSIFVTGAINGLLALIALIWVAIR